MKIQVTEPANHIAVFQEKAIRRTWDNEEWWFVIADVVTVPTDSVLPEDIAGEALLSLEGGKRSGEGGKPDHPRW